MIDDFAILLQINPTVTFAINSTKIYNNNTYN